MATIVKRGSGIKPRYFIRYEKAGITGQRWHRYHDPEDQNFAGKAGKERLELERLRVNRELAAGRDPYPEVIEPQAPAGTRALLEKWAAGLKNRNASNDRTIVNRHLVPQFGELLPTEITRKVVREWLTKMKDEAKLSTQTQRHCLTTLSRWFGWMLDDERGGIDVNPVKMLSKESRPVVEHVKREILDDDEKRAGLIAALPSPVDLMFALANRSGMRLGEVAGLRMSDLDSLAKGFILVSHSYDGPLKEAKNGKHREKKVPAPIDAEEVLKMHLARRRLNGAKPDDLVFVPLSPPKRRRVQAWTGFRKEHLNNVWRAACKSVGLVGEDGETPTITWYGATRTTTATAAAKADVPLEQIADALGHSGPEMVREHYNRHQRTEFAEALRLPMMPPAKTNP